jgi:hypothetical protein
VQAAAAQGFTRSGFLAEAARRMLRDRADPPDPARSATTCGGATTFVGVPEVTTLPSLLFAASMEGNYQTASITALVLLVPSVGFMLAIERFLKADVLAKVGS